MTTTPDSGWEYKHLRRYGATAEEDGAVKPCPDNGAWRSLVADLGRVGWELTAIEPEIQPPLGGNAGKGPTWVFKRPTELHRA